MADRAKRLGILGGCFNPVHCGHVRLALEALERLGLDRVELTPCHTPPHKDASELLDFTLRAHLARLAVQGLSRVAVNLIEADLPKPSYTLRTLQALKAREPGIELFFILGASDLLVLPNWHQGRQVMQLASFVVAPRAGDGIEAISDLMAASWPGTIRAEEPPQGMLAAWSAKYGDGRTGRVLVLDAPGLDISASNLRDLWRQGRSLRCLTPAAVESVLNDRAGEVAAAWGERLVHAHRL